MTTKTKDAEANDFYFWLGSDDEADPVSKREFEWMIARYEQLLKEFTNAKPS
jgi:hypothetical protein